jgi:Dyp-type peroxidase family
MSARHKAKRGLDFADIQGLILRPYSHYGFMAARHFFFNIADAKAGRKFVEDVRHSVTSGELWDSSATALPWPSVTVNIGFSFLGMLALALPTDTLREMPEEFIDGMAKRKHILGDVESGDGRSSDPKRWDDIWHYDLRTPERQVHIWVSLNAQIKPDGTPVDELAKCTEWLKRTAIESRGVTLLNGHKGTHLEYQGSSAIMAKLPDGRVVPTPREHFGFTDGIADPAFAGQYRPEEEAEYVPGNGKIAPGKRIWEPIATGEFILGHASEAQELPPVAMPWSFTRNGTFMAYRKLHQNIASFQDYADNQATLFQKVIGAASHDAAKETVLAKMVGRWSNGIPLSIAPTYEDFLSVSKAWADVLSPQPRNGSPTDQEKARQKAYKRLISDFQYGDDPEGGKCPFSSHIRRSNPRDALDPLLGTADHIPDTMLSNRRRIMRRGLPYGESIRDDASEHGVIFMVLCTSLFRQFEFVQQQWVNYGATFAAGNDTDPITGIRSGEAKFVIPADPAKGGVPFLCANMPLFVETRGGEYFFLPSLTALRQIAEGSVDPT